MKFERIVLWVTILSLLGCAFKDGQDQYNFNDVGQSTIVEFGTVIAVRKVKITGRNTGAGGLLGGSAGMIAGGNDSTAALVGAVVGAVAGFTAEQAIANNEKGIEYTLTKADGRTIMLVQNLKEEDVIFSIGQRVMIQTSGSYQRVLSVAHLPKAIKAS